MSKKVKIILSVIIIVAVIAVLLIFKPKTSSSVDAVPKTRNTITLYQNIINTNDKPFLVKLDLLEDVSNGFEKISSMYAKNGENIYTRVDGLFSVGTLKKEGKLYSFYHNTKEYYLTENLEYSNDFILFNNDIAHMSADNFKTGVAEIAGAEYNYEELEVNGDVVRFYYNIYDGGWEYLEVKENIFEVVEYTNEVDESLFEIPEGYTLREE